MEKLANIIKQNSNTKDKVSFVFIGYLILSEMKGILLQEGFSDNEMFKYLNRPLTLTKRKDSFNLTKNKICRNSFKMQNSNSFINLCNIRIESLELFYGKAYAIRVFNNWNELGMKTIANEIKSNKVGVDTIIQAFDSIDNLSIEDLIDLYEFLNISDRKLNDFFTPKDMSKTIAKMSLNFKDLKNKESINICDCCCGTGRLLYYAFIELRNKYPEKDINVYGIDISKKFSIFTTSIFNLININKTDIFVGNSLLTNVPIPKIDVLLSNPPFGTISDDEHNKVLLINQYLGKKDFKASEKKILSKLKPLNNEEYKVIINDWEVV